MSKVWAIIPAAGLGQRMNSERPKQYILINDEPILAHTLHAICQVPQVEQVVVALHPDDQYWPTQINLSYTNITTTQGGEFRAQSVLNAIQLLSAQANAQDWLLVHDAVRPCITAKTINAMLIQLEDHPIGGLLGVPVRDTLKAVDAQGNTTQTVSRAGLWHALTPQVFRFGLLQAALTTLIEDDFEITDDASAIEKMGHSPKMIQGSYDNIKITWPEDLATASAWLQQHQEMA